MNIEKGLKNTEEFAVTDNLTAASLGSGLLPVLSTPAMIAFMEGVCQHCLQPYLDDGYGTVGVEVNVRHLSATPVGMRVKTECELISSEGNMYTFEVRAFDECMSDRRGHAQAVHHQRRKVYEKNLVKAGKK